MGKTWHGYTLAKREEKAAKRRMSLGEYEDYLYDKAKSRVSRRRAAKSARALQLV